MAIVNPYPAGYAFGQRLPSAHVNYIWDALEGVLDVGGGGTHTMGAALNLGGTFPFGVTCPFSFNNDTWPLLNSRTVVLTQSLGGPVLNSNARWSFDLDGHWKQSDNTDGGPITFPLDRLINGGTLTAVSFRFDGDLNGGGNHAAFPATMPIVLVTKSLDTEPGTTLGTHTMNAAADFSSTIGNYDGVWTYTLDVTDTAIDLSQPNQYYCTISGEAGANSATGLTLLSVRCSFTTASLRY